MGSMRVGCTRKKNIQIIWQFQNRVPSNMVKNDVIHEELELDKTD